MRLLACCSHAWSCGTPLSPATNGPLERKASAFYGKIGNSSSTIGATGQPSLAWQHPRSVSSLARSAIESVWPPGAVMLVSSSIGHLARHQSALWQDWKSTRPGTRVDHKVHMLG